MTNRFQSLFDFQREHFLSDATKSHYWRINGSDGVDAPRWHLCARMETLITI